MDNKRVAASIEYGEGDNAPRLTAYGRGFVADKILEIAEKSGVPLYREENLAWMLGRVEIGRRFPRNCTVLLPRFYRSFTCSTKKKGMEGMTSGIRTGKMGEDAAKGTWKT